MRLHAAITATLITTAIITTPVAQATCDISQTKCALNGGKCNIHFKNRTADFGGSDGSSNLNQSSAAQAVAVKAQKKNGKKAGNTLVIQAGDTKTMNIDKKTKKNFDKIRIRSDNASGIYAGSTIPCEHVIRILNGNGVCKIFQGAEYLGGELQSRLGYQCDGGNVGGPNSEG
ncbi:MAG: hypothetical protein Hens2KO_29450 [Henriciella sp.]